jgi:ABC-type multidrug transport system fused ATPase/permease subunit
LADASAGEITAAAQAANAMEFIERLPQVLRSRIDSGGTFIGHGRILEQGTHAELMAQSGQDAVFHHLQYRSQDPLAPRSVEFDESLSA